MEPTFRELSWQLTVLVLSVLALILLGAGTVFELNDNVSALFIFFDTSICFVLLADVAYWGIIKKDGRKEYWKWGWLDLISSIPVFVFLRWGRIFRITKILLLLRKFKGSRELFKHLFKDQAAGTLFTVSMAALVLLIFGSIGILHFELDASGSNINNAQDAVWWAFVTITAGSYGDFYPVTFGGRLIAAVLMALGVGLFGIITAYLAKYWVGGSTKREMNEIKESLIRIEGRVKLRKRRR